MKTLLLTITYLFWPLLLLPAGPMVACILFAMWLTAQPVLFLAFLGLIAHGSPSAFETETDRWARQKAAHEDRQYAGVARTYRPVYYRDGFNPQVEAKRIPAP